MARLEGAVHRVAADGHAGAQRRSRRWRVRFAEALAAELAGGGRRRSTTRRCSTSTPTRRTRSSATGRWPRMPSRWRGWARRSSTRCRRKGVAACGKHFQGMATPRSIPIWNCRSSSIAPDRIRRVECVPFRGGHRGRGGVHHDGPRAGAVARRGSGRPRCRRTSSRALLREELGFEGVILSDDLEMKAIAATYAVPDAAVQAIAAGCDGAAHLQRRHRTCRRVTLEALVHAVEDGTHPVQASRGRADAPARRQGADPRRTACRRAIRTRPMAAAASGARLRRPPPRGRRDGASSS